MMDLLLVTLPAADYFSASKTCCEDEKSWRTLIWLRLLALFFSFEILDDNNAQVVGILSTPTVFFLSYIKHLYIALDQKRAKLDSGLLESRNSSRQFKSRKGYNN